MTANPTDNVLVSRKKWEKMLESLAACDEAMGYMSEYAIPLCMPERIKKALAMPNFIESEWDVNVIMAAIRDAGEHFIQAAMFRGAKSLVDGQSRAAINALRYRKEDE